MRLLRDGKLGLARKARQTSLNLVWRASRSMKSVATQHAILSMQERAEHRLGAGVRKAHDRRASEIAKTFMLESGSDEELMAQIAAGDHAAFRVLMGRHMRRAIRVAQGVLRQSAEADDVAQEAFLRLWRHAGAFDPERARFTTWMHRIVVNLAIDRTRQPRTQPIDAAYDVADNTPGPFVALVQSQEQRAIAEALAQMPARQRAAITLFHFEGLSGRESAQALELSEAAFESLLARARATLKRSIETPEKNGREP